LAVRLGPTTKTFLDCVAQGIQTFWDEVREVEIYGPSFCLMSGGLDYTMKSDPESKDISVSWFLHHNPPGLLVLISSHLDG
jgi:hypothetical protein